MLLQCVVKVLKKGNGVLKLTGPYLCVDPFRTLILSLYKLLTTKAGP